MGITSLYVSKTRSFNQGTLSNAIQSPSLSRSQSCDSFYPTLESSRECALRNLVGRSLVALYTRGETRTLFDTVQALHRIGDVNILEKDVLKVCVATICFQYNSC